MDAPTINRQALAYVRICVDMFAASLFPSTILLDLDEGATTVVGVEYPRKPQACTLCKVFDHANKSCPKAVRREWLPKQVVEASRKLDDAEGWIRIKRKKPQVMTVPATPPVRDQDVTPDSEPELSR
ncbi:zf-CCHC_4 domain-containing protein [Cephalotus follicularis]|uniref:Zf-CCHC_4 domain-containing protein n=1 Tax=Cephalotus follicularis TaxID=3775 RepID=A0A1Q3C8I6_CEPFO|nr:zf-CCHC_4 domain-containing protein [Cephalotus follicularis]